MLEAGQLVGLQAAHGQAGHLIEMLTQLVCQLLAGRAGAGAGDHGPGGELEQPFHQGMAAVDQQHVVLGQARQALLH